MKASVVAQKFGFKLKPALAADGSVDPSRVALKVPLTSRILPLLLGAFVGALVKETKEATRIEGHKYLIALIPADRFAKGRLTDAHLARIAALEYEGQFGKLALAA